MSLSTCPLSGLDCDVGIVPFPCCFDSIVRHVQPRADDSVLFRNPLQASIFSVSIWLPPIFTPRPPSRRFNFSRRIGHPRSPYPPASWPEAWFTILRGSCQRGTNEAWSNQSKLCPPFNLPILSEIMLSICSLILFSTLWNFNKAQCQACISSKQNLST